MTFRATVEIGLAYEVGKPDAEVCLRLCEVHMILPVRANTNCITIDADRLETLLAFVRDTVARVDHTTPEEAEAGRAGRAQAMSETWR